VREGEVHQRRIIDTSSSAPARAAGSAAPRSEAEEIALERICEVAAAELTALGETEVVEEVQSRLRAVRAYSTEDARTIVIAALAERGWEVEPATGRPRAVVRVLHGCASEAVVAEVIEHPGRQRFWLARPWELADQGTAARRGADPLDLLEASQNERCPGCGVMIAIDAARVRAALAEYDRAGRPQKVMVPISG
jgi:hypothetical protein